MMNQLLTVLRHFVLLSFAAVIFERENDGKRGSDEGALANRHNDVAKQNVRAHRLAMSDDRLLEGGAEESVGRG